MELNGGIADRYRDFAAYARDDSPTFGAWSLGVADDPEVHAWLADLPRLKQQPNLVFAAARWHGATGAYDEFKGVLTGREAAVKATIRARATQTNEVGRLATLVPVLGLIEGPLALIEVGASAGLCLYADRYDYAWPDLGGLAGSGGTTLTAAATGAVPIPEQHPEIAWRGGVDLNPLDVTDEEQMAWLEVLVWPEQDERRARLREAIAIARQDPPTIRTGDLFDHVEELIEEGSGTGTPVVFHSAVIAYLEDDSRERFHKMMTDLVNAGACHWISNEGPQVLPGITGDLAVPQGRFVMGLDGRPVAFTHGHGHAIDWL